METSSAIQRRRSIRRFLPKKLAKEQLQSILQAGTLAPSAKNRQPWKFVVVTESNVFALCDAMETGLLREEAGEGLLPGSRRYIEAAKNTLAIMRSAPATILVFEPNTAPLCSKTAEEWFFNCANHQSVGAAIQNMCLAAQDMGLGSLWICDVFFAQAEITAFAEESGRLVAALTLGYPDEAPAARPRRPLAHTVVWR